MANVVIVDDESAIRFFYRYALKGTEHKLFEMEDGDSAIAGLKSITPFPDVIFLDHRMPNKDGLQTLLEIRSDHPQAKVVIISGDETARDQAFEQGAVGFLEKPISKDMLIQAVKKFTM
jgi:DNA-binding NtrC family response regulator